jgi:hypothetical protein
MAIAAPVSPLRRSRRLREDFLAWRVDGGVQVNFDCLVSSQRAFRSVMAAGPQHCLSLSTRSIDVTFRGMCFNLPCAGMAPALDASAEHHPLPPNGPGSGSCVSLLWDVLALSIYWGHARFFIESVKKPNDNAAAPGPALRALHDGTGDRRDPGPPRAPRWGTRFACGPFPSPCRPARGKDHTGPVGHSVGGKVAVCTNHVKVWRSGHGVNGHGDM